MTSTTVRKFKSMILFGSVRGMNKLIEASSYTDFEYLMFVSGLLNDIERPLFIMELRSEFYHV